MKPTNSPDGGIGASGMPPNVYVTWYGRILPLCNFRKIGILAWSTRQLPECRAAVSTSLPDSLTMSRTRASSGSTTEHHLCPHASMCCSFMLQLGVRVRYTIELSYRILLVPPCPSIPPCLHHVNMLQKKQAACMRHCQ